MASHKFKIGEIVTIRPALSRNVPGGLYEVTNISPARLDAGSRAAQKKAPRERG
jgi:hypothetical protein